jgi:hypothetical protein
MPHGLPRSLKKAGANSTLPVATATAVGTVKKAATVAAITDSSGGTSGGNTVAAIVAATDTTAAGLATTKNAIATLSAKVNAMLTALKNAGIMS